MSRINKSLDKAHKTRGKSFPARKNLAPPPDAHQLYHSPHEEEKVHLRDYLEVLIRRKLIVICFFVVVVTTVTVASFLMTPMYKALTSIHLKTGKAELTAFREVYEDQSAMMTQYKILNSRKIAKMAARSIPKTVIPEPSDSTFWSSIVNLIPGLGKKEQVKNTSNERLSASVVSQGLEIQPVKNTDIVNISFMSQYPEFAAYVANKVAESYQRFNQESKIKPIIEGRDRLKNQVDKIRDKLDSSEKDLNKFITESAFILKKEGNKYENLLDEKLKKLDSELDDAISERIASEAFYKEAYKSGISSRLNLDNPILRTLMQDLIKRESEYYNLLLIHKPEYPKMVRLKDRIEKLKDRIDFEEQEIINSIYSKYQQALGKETLLSSALEKLRGDASLFQEHFTKALRLSREVETTRMVYASLLQRLEEVNVSTALAESDVQILDSARIPKKPFRPQKARNIFLSIFAGLLGGVLIAFFVEYFDNTVKTDDDIENIARLPVLGRIPKIKTDPRILIHVDSNGNGNSNSKGNIALDKAVFSDAFRYLSTRIQYSNASKKILITSPVAQEGKTIISVNIARSLMTSQENGIIVDADLRRPDIHILFDLDNSTGLSSFLTGETNFDGLIKKSPYARLDVITAGPMQTNNSEYFHSSRMRKLINALSVKYDYIIFDSAPVLGMSDSLILSTVADTVIVVVKANTTPLDALIQTNKALNSVNADTSGFILNGVNRKNGFGYSSGYVSSHYSKENPKMEKLLK